MDTIELTGGPIESEFSPEEYYYRVFYGHGMHPGRMVGGSKSGYVMKHPDNHVIFNANIVTEKSGKIWYGDIDLTEEYDTFKDIADELKEDLYVLNEMDARFENENNPIEQFISKAKFIIYSR